MSEVPLEIDSMMRHIEEGTQGFSVNPWGLAPEPLLHDVPEKK